MSHYSVAVFTVDNGLSVGELLSPYDENISVEKHLYKTKKEIIDDMKDSINSYYENTYKKYLEDPEKFLNDVFDGKKDAPQFKYLTDEFPERLNWSDEDCYKHYLEMYVHDENMIDVKTGDVYSTYNPKSKWDWYSTGGRWGGELLLKSDSQSSNLGSDDLAYVDEAPIEDIDFDKMEQIAKEDLVPYSEFMEKDNFYKKEYLQKIYPDEETYIQENTVFSTFAVITPDGKWHECGEMGWFGCSSETPEERTAWHRNYKKRFIETGLKNGWYLTMIDCHI